MSKDFIERPRKNEKDGAIAYVQELLKQAREDRRNDDVDKLENLICLLNTKKYGLVWEEHAELVEEEMKTKIPVFVEDETKKIMGNPESEDYNFLLEGDNLHSLHLLKKTHAGKIDVIYIDPPYNTGNKDFVYNDKIIDKTDGYSHSKWLSFMSNRLNIARELLSDSGVIFISIADHEQAQLKLLCDGIFGSENFIASFIWKITGHTDNQEDVTQNHEYIHCYSKHKSKVKINNIIDPNIPEDSKVRRNFAENSITKNGAKNPPSFIELPEGFPCVTEELKREAFEKFDDFFNEVTENKFISRGLTKKYSASYPIPVTEMIVSNYKLERNCTVFSGWANNGKLKKFIKNNCEPIEDNGTYIKFFLSKNGVIYYRRENRESHYVQTVLENLGTTETNKYMLEGMGIGFDYPKPIDLIKYIVSLYSKKESWVLDFFAGSGTTGHAVAQLNKEDGGNRKFILCTNNENKIAEEVTYKRLANIQAELPHNLKYFKTDFVVKEEFPDVTLEYELLNYVTPLVELEFGVDISNPKVQVILSEDQLDEMDESDFVENSTLFFHPEIFFDAKQESILREKNITKQEIPDYYFGKDIWL